MNKTNILPIFIPDTHGHATQLKRLLKQLENEDLLQNRTICFLGDYLDQGTEVPELLDLLIELQSQGHICISGNHDLVMRALITPGEHLERWYTRWKDNYSPWQTLDAYGIDSSHLPDTADLVPAFLRNRIPDRHLNFIENLPLYWEHGPWLAIHAGACPEKELTHPAAEAYRLEKGIKAMPWTEQKSELDQMMNDPQALFAGLGPQQVSYKKLTQLSKNTGLPWEELHQPACVVSGHWIQEQQNPHISPRRALLDMGVADNRNMIAWIPDQDKIITEPGRRRF